MYEVLKPYQLREIQWKMLWNLQRFKTTIGVMNEVSSKSEVDDSAKKWLKTMYIAENQLLGVQKIDLRVWKNHLTKLLWLKDLDRKEWVQYFDLKTYIKCGYLPTKNSSCISFESRLFTFGNQNTLAKKLNKLLLNHPRILCDYIWYNYCAIKLNLSFNPTRFSEGEKIILCSFFTFME